MNLPTVGFSGSFCEQSLQFRRFRPVFSSAVWCEPFRLRLRYCYLAQHASRIVQAGVSGLAVGGQSLPLRHCLGFRKASELLRAAGFFELFVFSQRAVERGGTAAGT